MKELLDRTNKTEWLTTIFFKISTYLCWYLFAYIFLMFLKDTLSDFKLIVLVIMLLLVYVARLYLKNEYKKVANDSYYNIKHAIEMFYFSKLNNLKYSELEKIDKEDLANKILEVSYNYTRIINDLGEYLIPAGIGLFIMLIKLIEINTFFGIFSLFALVAIMIYSYLHIDVSNNKATNYNDLLVDYISKILTIKKLNIFDYCNKTLDDEKKENDICILKNNEAIPDDNINILTFAYISFILIATFLFIRNTVTRLGVIIFLITIIIKIQELIPKINPAIKNMFESSKNKAVLDEILKNEVESNVVDEWKKVSIKDGVVNYNETTPNIKIPNFELVKKDHVSILGKAGQGKSTILNILSGIFSLDKGSVYIDSEETTKKVDAVYVSKNTDIFKVSLRNNIINDKEISDEDIINAIKEIGLDTWYNTLPDGLETILSDNLKASIKIRINILRGIFMDKDVYFLDEPSEGLTEDEEKKVANIIKKRLKDKTYIIVSKSSIITNHCKKHYFVKDHTLLEKEPLL